MFFVVMESFGFLLPLSLPLSTPLILLFLLISLVILLHLAAIKVPRHFERIEREEKARRQKSTSGEGESEEGEREGGPRRYSAANSKVKKYGQRQVNGDGAKANPFAL